MRNAALVSAVLLGSAGTARAVPVSFTTLSGVTGGTPASTAVFRADLGSLGAGQVGSVTIADNSGGLGGSAGQFSGFDLDTIVISTTFISSATDVGSLVPAATFDFAASLLTPGTQRPPTDPALFGTVGGQVNNAVATLNQFDGNSTTAVPGAFGFVSLGDGGVLSINLVSTLQISGPLYLYIGEVGNNGEVAASNITVNATPVAVPEPASLALLSAGLAAVALRRRRDVGRA